MARNSGVLLIASKVTEDLGTHTIITHYMSRIAAILPLKKAYRGGSRWTTFPSHLMMLLLHLPRVCLFRPGYASCSVIQWIWQGFGLWNELCRSIYGVLDQYHGLIISKGETASTGGGSITPYP